MSCEVPEPGRLLNHLSRSLTNYSMIMPLQDIRLPISAPVRRSLCQQSMPADDAPGRRILLSVMYLAVIVFTGMPAHAGQQVFNSGEAQVTLLELYTSQGCNSCPPAERWLNAYVDSEALWEKTVPVVFHVDYWDYLGWKDTLADSAHAERQRNYARQGRARTVYTPGMFVNGREWRGWTFRLPPRVSDRRPGNLAVTITDRQLAAVFRHSADPLELHVALLGFGIETSIERGENRNRTLRQEFVVLSHAVHGAPGGRWRVPLPEVNDRHTGRRALAVWVSEPGNPVPLQATGGWLD